MGGEEIAVTFLGEGAAGGGEYAGIVTGVALGEGCGGDARIDDGVRQQMREEIEWIQGERVEVGWQAEEEKIWVG